MPSDIAPTASGREVTFNLLGEPSFTYDVTVSALPGEHTFDGALTYVRWSRPSVGDGGRRAVHHSQCDSVHQSHFRAREWTRSR